MGYIVSSKYIKDDPKKFMAITELLSPNSITLLRGFMGLTGYHRRCICNYTQIVVPLTSLLKMDDFRWDKDEKTCFEPLKPLMKSTLVLEYPNFTKTFILECDALREMH